MELRIDQNVLDRFPSLHIVQENDVVTVKFDGENNSDFLFPMSLPMTNLDHISWGRVNEIAAAGKAREYFALGATKKDYMKNGFVATYQIIGFDHDDLADNSGKAPLSWDMVDLYKDEKAMRGNGDSVWWKDTDIRSFLNSDFKNNVSDELAAVVKTVWKLSANRKGEMEKTADDFWLKSEQELYGRAFWSYGGEGFWYEFYKQENIAYFKKNINNEKDWQWLRSVRAGHSNGFCSVDTSGSAGTTAPAIRVGSPRLSVCKTTLFIFISLFKAKAENKEIWRWTSHPIIINER